MASLVTYNKWKEFNNEARNFHENENEFYVRFAYHLDHVMTIENLIPIINRSRFRDCLKETSQLLSDGILLQQLDWADTEKLTSVMKLFQSFANIKILNFSYQIVSTALKAIYKKSKWYDISLFFNLPPCSTEQDSEQQEINENVEKMDIEKNPEDPEINWKDLVKFASNNDEVKLKISVIELLSRKLHVLAIAYNTLEYHDFATKIYKNGLKVVEELIKLIELSDEVGKNLKIDETFLTVMLPFMLPNHMKIICDIIVDRIFASFHNTVEQDSDGLNGKFQIEKILHHSIFRDNVDLQTCFVTSLINHLISNILRNSKRSKHEDGQSDNENSEIQVIINEIANDLFCQSKNDNAESEEENGEESEESDFGSCDSESEKEQKKRKKMAKELENSLKNTKLSKEERLGLKCWTGLQKASNGTAEKLCEKIREKKLQKNYIVQWLSILDEYCDETFSRSLEIKNRLRIFLTTSIVLFATSSLLKKSTVDLILVQLNKLIANIETHGDVQKFFLHIPFDKYLIKLLEKLQLTTETFSRLDACTKYEEFLSTILALFMRHTFKSIIRTQDHLQQEEKFTNFLNHVITMSPVDENTDYNNTFLGAQIVTQVTIMKQALIIETLSRVKYNNEISPQQQNTAGQKSLLLLVNPCAKRVRRFVKGNKSILLENDINDEQILEKNLLVLSIVSLFKSNVIQRDEDGLLKDKSMLLKLFKLIVKDLHDYLNVRRTGRAENGEVKFNFCSSQCIDLIRFYYKHQGFIRKSLNLDLNYPLACALLLSKTDNDLELCDFNDTETYNFMLDDKRFNSLRLPETIISACTIPRQLTVADKGQIQQNDTNEKTTKSDDGKINLNIDTDIEEEAENSQEMELYKILSNRSKKVKKNSQKMSERILSLYQAQSKQLKLVKIKSKNVDYEFRNDECSLDMRKLLTDISIHLLNSLNIDEFSVFSERVCFDLMSSNYLATNHSSLIRIIVLTELLFSVASHATSSTDLLNQKHAILNEKCEFSLQALIILAKALESHAIQFASMSANDQAKYLQSHSDFKSVHCCTLTHSLHALTQILKKKPIQQQKLQTKLQKIQQLRQIKQQQIKDSKMFQAAFQMISGANLNDYANSIEHQQQFLALANSIYRCLNECLIFIRANNDVMAVFIVIFGDLLNNLILASEQERFDSISFNQIDYANNLRKFESLAMNVSRILTQLSKLGKSFIPHAPFLIAKYIESVQLVTCHPRIRLHLNEGIYRIFNLIDAHQEQHEQEQQRLRHQRKTDSVSRGSLFEMIHARMDQSSREILRIMHETYDKFYRYRAKC